VVNESIFGNGRVISVDGSAALTINPEFVEKD